MKIRVLSQNLINQIAAGEVIERPASAVKELVENALDAGAGKIEIAARGAGKAYISVADDGAGMSRADLETCILRHATSKLPEDDLSNIAFLGFRGEALPSIASVARLAITTNDGSGGWKLDADGGGAAKVSPAALERGTRAEVSDLFFNVPARLKFLKTDRGEMSAIIDTVERIALCRPDVEFSLEGAFRFRPGSRFDRVRDVLGREFGEAALEISERRGDVSIYGYASRPTWARGTSASQYFFVNGRALKDRTLLGALRAAYADVIEKGRFPACALWIEIPRGGVDVNVHPQKAEVRFREPALVRSLIVGAVRNALAGAAVKPEAAWAANPERSFATRHAPSLVPAQEFFAGEVREVGANPASVGTGESDAAIEDRPLGAARGQLFNTYIVSQAADGIVIADQHACHERIVYERLKREIAAGGVKRQIMLIPETVELGSKGALAIMEIAGELAQFGLAVEEFGPGAVAVREVPAAIADADLQGLVRRIAEDAGELERARVLEDKLAMISKTFACHTSIRAGRSLSAAEMDGLLRQTEACENAGQCNHGRRAYVKLSRKDLEKLFDR
ncbi:MAG: DNA mismatch repair endonuclease MutL [Rickettsiales bacterium]|jgi:DNA mismatch repair protein MutL|nr:DNA mismatch repair endonuclease MutL [Rickettsiales bacterium]